MTKPVKICVVFVFFLEINFALGAMTMKQFEDTMKMMKTTCVPKTKVPPELAEGLRNGEFPDVKELKCYTMCIAQMSGLLDRKNQFSVPKIQTQIDTVMPSELRGTAQRVLEACKDTFAVPKTKDPCEKAFQTTKCMYDFDPAGFTYP